MSRPICPRWSAISSLLRGALAVLAAAPLTLLIGCASEQSIARDLANAATPGHLPLVVACWEKEFEATSFRGRYLATINFEVDSGGARIRDAKVVSIEPAKDIPPRDLSSFTACVEDALNRSSLPAVTDKDGPGFTAPSDLVVRGYRMEFVDASQSKRRAASQRQGRVLLGPRADRCQGLYTHDPTRDASTLYAEIAAGEARAARAKSEDRGLYARELQRTYDAKLELRERLTEDLADPQLPERNKKRIRQALDELEESARKTGALIGCAPPPVRSP